MARSFMARPFLPSYFPGYDIYLWIDSDAWLQGDRAFHDFVEGAAEFGGAVAHERERAYEINPRLMAWTAKHAMLGGGVVQGLGLIPRRQINAGIFAIAADAPHWDRWASYYQQAVARTGKLTPYDQVALNFAIYDGIDRRRDPVPTKMLQPAWNWICGRGVPMWDDASNAFCVPYAPYRPIHAIHLAGIGKRREFIVKRTQGGSFSTMIVHGSSPDHLILATDAA